MSKRIRRFVRRVGLELGIEASLEVARGYLLERLNEVTADDLYEAIQSGTHSLGVSSEKDKRFGRKLARRFRKVLYEGRSARDHLTPQLCLEWLKEDRPDLASLIINMGEPAEKWLEEDATKVREFLWPEKESGQTS